MSLATGATLLVRNLIAPNLSVPTFVFRRAEQIEPPFVVVATDELEPLNTKDPVAKIRTQIILATNAYSTSPEDHEIWLAELEAQVFALKRMYNLTDGVTCWYGSYIERKGQTRTDEDARTQTRGDMFYLRAGAGYAQQGSGDEITMPVNFNALQALETSLRPVKEDLIGTRDGANRAFTTSQPYQPGLIFVGYSGLAAAKGAHYSEGPGEGGITMAVGFEPLPDVPLFAIYWPQP